MKTRPCESCQYRINGSCSKWECVYEVRTKPNSDTTSMSDENESEDRELLEEI